MNILLQKSAAIQPRTRLPKLLKNERTRGFPDWQCQVASVSAANTNYLRSDLDDSAPTCQMTSQFLELQHEVCGGILQLFLVSHATDEDT